MRRDRFRFPPMVGGKQFPRGGAEPVPERAGKGKAARIVELRRRFLSVNV